jgi:3',5'-cyclic AMP phosphodiesterase CpdA
MLRIAHISDLHIRHPNMDNDNHTLLQTAFELLGKKMFDLEVEADAHDDQKLVALINILRGMEPDVIVVTGDLTNFGDSGSFQMACEFLMKLKESTGAQSILCVPGNHDCLCERAAALQATSKAKWFIRLLAKVSPEVAVMSRPQPPDLNQQFLKLLDTADGLTLLENYHNEIASKGFGIVDPSHPVLLDAGWGKVALFLFNSVNEPGFMANKGRIGQAQFNLLNRCLQDPEKFESCANAVRIALLHHHPISAPLALAGDMNRLYDWMSDGPMMLQYLNKQNFHFILHGHQHEPFQCTVNYQEIGGSGLHIVAAGSATQGKKKPSKNSFNLIDLLTPFEARLRRYDYWGDAGFDNAKTSLDVILPVRSIEEVRVTSGESPTAEDWAMRQLVVGANKDAYDIDSQHQYEWLDYLANIDKYQTYRAAYRRVGTVIGNKESDGLIFVITGSPAMKRKHMNLSATNNLDGDKLTLEVISDEPHQKVIHVRSRMLMQPGDKFDITLFFAWQATASEPHDFDGINLMSFRHRVEKVTYRAVLAWRPAQTKVLAYGVSNFAPGLLNQTSKSADSSGYWEYSFELEDPQPMAYLISFRPK